MDGETLSTDDNLKQVGLEQVAKVAGLSKQYDIFYRALSNFSAHPTITALSYHLQGDAQGLATGLRWGPDASDIPDTLMAVCSACVQLVAWAGDILKSAELNKELSQCIGGYKRVMGEMGKHTQSN